MDRYEWRKPSDLPDRLELFDNLEGRKVAVIISVGREWQWHRNTTVMLDGAPPSDGMARTLMQAKVKVLDGLPNE